MESNMEIKNKEIIRILEKHPEGMTMVDIAKLLDMHRLSVVKYIYALVGAGIIYQRIVGPAKICYLKKR